MLSSLHSLIVDDSAVNSSAVFVYDSTPSAAFGGDLTKTSASSAEVWQMQTRPGAGSALVGFVNSIAFTSKGAAAVSDDETVEEAQVVPAKRSAGSNGVSAKKVKTVDTAATTANKPITVLGSTASFLSLVPSLLALPSSNLRPALAIHVSAQTSSLRTDAAGSEELTQVPDLGSLFEGVQSLVEGDWTGAILLSETAEEGSKVGTGVAHSLTGAGFDLIHVFDGLTAGRELSALAASTKVDSEGQSIETILEKAGVSYFSYEGSATATQVIVLPASTYSSCAKAALAALTPSSVEVGILTVHVVKPWSADAFIAALPASTKALHVYKSDESHISPFHTDILTSLLSPPGFKLKMRSLATSASTVPTVLEWASTIANLSSASPASSPASADAVIPTIKSLLPEQSKLAVFWDLDASTGQTELVPQALAQAFAASNTGVSAKLSTKYDNFSQGGIQLSSLLLESNEAISHAFTLDALVATTPPSLLFISSPAVFKSYEPISASTVAASTRVVISAKWTKDEVAAKLPTSARKALASVFAASKGSIYVVDADALAAAHSIPAKEVSEIVFWSLYLPSTISAKEIVTILAGTPTFAGFKHDCLVEINSAVRNAIIQVEVPSTWSEDAMVVDGAKVEEEKTFPTLLHATAAGPNADRTFSDPLVEMIGGSKKSWHQVAQSLIFPQAFGRTNDTEERMRPDLPEKNFMVTVTENRRLTPTNYDRNVFHLEFSTAGTGLKYSVGEALGIHGWNDSAEVSEFLEWYGLDPEAIVSAPAREDSSRVEQRTIFQMFQQSLDIFGKPSKSFYDNLSAHATSINESRALRFIACADGAATFKKMSEVDTLTYADVFRMFPSAKMPIDVLVKEVEEIKPRHYSIASSQNFVGDQVHLLIVTVDWVDPKGKTRFGQCTRYLNDLVAGDKVMVSVKPSVMKLPPMDSAPIIMAGLGTGAAPFRAFIQERAWQKQQGMDVGPALYYFGSRHRSKEYLYGEEIEAYVNEGVVTHTGLAFSRDTDKKVYIQHKMNEDAQLLATMMEKGTFFLCGPTWPVPDVYEALVKAFMGTGKTIEEAQAYIETLKEEERYVLEVY